MLEYILSLFLISPLASDKADKYDRILETMTKIVRENSQNASLFELGMSDSGKKIMGVKIGSGPIADLVVGTHHGNEYGSTAVAMGTMADLARVPIQGHTVYVIPVLNISGYNSQSRHESTSHGSIDPNRDYPSPCGTSGPFFSKATKALADFVDQKNVISVATLHTYFPGVLYPWGISTNDISTEYDETFINLSRLATENSHYQYGNSKELLYAADGTFEDYAFWKHGIWSLLFELGHSHNPNDADMKQMIELNSPGIRRFLAAAPSQRAPNHEFKGRCDSASIRRVHLE